VEVAAHQEERWVSEFQKRKKKKKCDGAKNAAGVLATLPEDSPEHKDAYIDALIPIPELIG